MAETTVRTRDGVDLAVFDTGGSDPCALLLHGLAGYAGEWQSTVRWLRQTHRVVTFDQRGHGRSTRRPSDVSGAAFAADVVEIVERLVLGRVTLVGQSLGGHIALLVAANRPDLVRALVVAEASPESDPAAPARVQQWLASWPPSFPSREEAVEFFGGDSSAGHAWASGLEQRNDSLWPSFDADVMIRAVVETGKREAWDDWQRIVVPTLIVRGSRGWLGNDTVARMMLKLAGAESTTVADVGHDVHLDQPDGWRRALEPFLDETS